MFPGTRVGLQELWGFSKHGTPKTKRDGLWQRKSPHAKHALQSTPYDWWSLQRMLWAVSKLWADPFCKPKKDAKAEKLLSSWIFFQGSCFPFHSQSTPVSCVRFPRLVPTPAQSFQISCLKIQPFDIRSPVILGLKISFAINKPQMPDIAALLPVQNIAGSAIPPSWRLAANWQFSGNVVWFCAVLS